MPKVYTSSAERQEQRIIRTLKGAADGKHDALAAAWGITRQAADYRIKNGNITLLDLWKARHLLDFDAKDIEFLIKERS